MKTKHIKITKRTARKSPRILVAFITAFLGLSPVAQGQTPDLFWTGGFDILPEDAVDGDWTTNDEENWSTGESTPGNTFWMDDNLAHFVGLSGAMVTLTSDISALGIDYGSQAGPFTIDTNGLSLTFSSAGIVNNSAALQTIDNSGQLNFFNNATVVNLAGGAVTITNTGQIVFFDSSSGGDAAFVNQDPGASIEFSLLASAGATMGSIAGNGTIFLGSKNLTVGSNNSSTLFSGVISDGGEGGGTGGSLTKVGTGTLTLSGTNTYTGLTIVRETGILNIQNGSALGATTTDTLVEGGATLQLEGDISVGAEALEINGAGAAGQSGALVNVSGTNNYGGLLTLFGDSTISSDSGTLNLTNTGTITGPTFGLVLTGAGDGSILSIIGTTTGTLTKSGAGTWTLTGANTYTGVTSISAGILNIQNSTALGTSAAGTTVSSGATLQIQGGITVGAEPLTISGTGASGGTGAFENVSGTNNYGGLLTLGGASTISSDAGTLNLTNTGTITGAGFGLTLTGAGNGTISSIIGTGPGTVTKNGSGQWTLSGANTYSGGTMVNDGTLLAGVTAAIFSTSALTVATGAIFDLNSFDQSVGSLAGGGNITLGAATLTTGNDSTSTDFAGVISGSGTLIKTGTGIQTLSGTNNFGGPTTVALGTLLVDGSLLSGVGVDSGATLGGMGTVFGGVAIADGGILAPGDSPGTLTVGSLFVNNASLLNYELGTAGVIDMGINDLTIVLGDLTLDGILNTTALADFGQGAYRLFSYGGDLTDNTLDIGTVPAGFTASDFTIVTGLPNEVDLLVIADAAGPIQFWDGADTEADGMIDGGTGSWDNFATNWTDAAGETNSFWLSGEAVFAGAAGMVTVIGPIFFTGLEFMTNGYEIDAGRAGRLQLIGSPMITTDSNVIATITAPIDGEGGIVKEGPGTLVLSGVNTYFGSTAINAGTLSISSDVNLGTAPSEEPVADQLTFNGGVLQVTASFALDANRGITLLTGGGSIGVTDSNILNYGGVITGAGSLFKFDTGTLLLSGINTYTGTTRVAGGTLQAGATGVVPSQNALEVDTGATFDLNNFDQSIGVLIGGGSVTLGTATLTTGIDNLPGTFAGVVSGAGGLTKVGTGTQTLSGGNVYLGGTAVTMGTLQAGIINTLPSSTALSVDAGGTFDLNSFDQSIGSLTGDGSVTLGTATLTTGNDNTSTDFAGIISGSGGLTKVGSGVQTLSGGNIYTGATTVSHGILMAGVANTLPSQTAVVALTGATLDLNSLDQSIGSLADAGSVTLGAATLTTGNNNTSTDFSGIISGSGAVTKVGTGTQTLSGANTYTGVTTVNDGSLFVDGSIISAQTFVNPGGLLGGQGLIGGSLVNSGIVSPGHSPGTLTIGTNYTQTTDGTLRIEVAGLGASDHDLLVVDGTATLNGTLQIIRLGTFEFSLGDQITILVADGGLKGTFNPIENDFFVLGTFAQTQVIYFLHSVALEATQGSFADFASAFCPTPNDIAVGAALDSAVGDSRATELIDFLNAESLDSLCRDLELISPEELVSVFNIGVSLSNVQTANLERRMDDVRAGSNGFSAAGFVMKGNNPGWNGSLAGPTGPEGKSGESVFQPTPDNRWGVFVTGLGEFTSVDNTSNAVGFDLSTGGLTFGIDYRISPNVAVGLTGGYAHTRADIADNGQIDVDGGKLGLYATVFSGGFYVDAAVTGGFSDYDTRRTAILNEARGNTNGNDITTLLSAGYDWKRGSLSIGPTVNFQYTYVSVDEFTESGSLAPLILNDQSAESIRTALGIKASYDCKIGGVLLKPELRAAWQHEFGDTNYALVSRFANGAGNSFTVHGPTIGRDSVLIGAGAALQLNDRISTYAYYDGELGRTNNVSHNISAGIRVNF